MPRYQELQNREWLHQKYEVEFETTTSIAAELGCTPVAVLRALQRCGITLRPRRTGIRRLQLEQLGRTKCNVCGLWKDASEFVRSKRRRGGLLLTCRKCYSARGKQWRQEHSGHVREHDTQRMREWRYKQLGITEEDFQRLYAEQGGVCAICRGDNGSKRLAVDHDHQTGDVRGLLCTACNRSLASFEVRASREALERYLGRPRLTV